MSDLIEFARRIKEELNAADREPHWETGDAERYMEQVAERREQFEELALRLTETVIRPRLETLAGYFPNASLSSDEPPGCCACWFGYCERFPASTRAAFSVEHDVRFENAAVCFEASMTPQFIKLNEADKLTAQLAELNEDAVAGWVEERLLEFLDDYLRIDRGGDDFDEEAVIDPVCGMRIGRSSAAATDVYRGHTYFFCSPECQARFARQPTAYVVVKSF